MFKRKSIVIAGLSLVLLLPIAAFGQEKGNRTTSSQKTTTSTATKRKSGKYANQEVGYRKAKTSGANTSANGSAQPVNEQNRLKKQNPKQQNLLPYLEQSNLRRRKAQPRK